MFMYVRYMYDEQKHPIDLTEEAIATNRDALLGIVAWLFTMLGLEERSNRALPRMPRPLHRALLRVLVPAEAALRRLIVFAAQGLTVTLKPASSAHPRLPPQRGRTEKGRMSPPVFPLVDPKQRAGHPRRPKARPRAEPRLSVFDRDGFLVCSSDAPRPKPRRPKPDGLIDPKRLCRRLEALKRALQDIPRQAKRLARWRARQEQKQASTSTPTLKPLSPLREGPPPGYRKKRQHEVDDILAECHDLACLALAPDTS
jgi:hypothetical protein